ncbi:MAG: chloride channel protein [Jaaginema sp. PMC 1080.18]|nr:chloride channel protein [Jaaginema sp. PMC 1080.18]MEC4868109.1 chloride channel protein [Jaaginema sp. PMC 1078.18]
MSARFGLKHLKSWIRHRHIGNESTKTYYALLEASVIGCISALAALLLKQGINFIGSTRVQLAQDFGQWTLPLFGLTLGLLGGWIVEQLSPAAKGSGIPQVKAVLAQFPVPLSLQVAVVKLIGTILVLGGGLALGRRGPTVHIGAAVAAQISYWIPTSPQHRRQMIAAGAAAGLAAGFNTPIAGVLFVVEELSRDMSSLTLETAILASFTGSVVSRSIGTTDFNLPPEMLNNLAENAFQFKAHDIPWFLLLGVLAGILGSLFSQGVLASLDFNRRLRWPMALRVGLAGLVSGSIVALSPPLLRDNAGLREFFLSGDVGGTETAIVFGIYCLLTLIAYGSGAPGGLFSPALVFGSALGYLVGQGAVFFQTDTSASKYALVGMAAFFSAVARVPVTAIAIVFEMTAEFNLVLPLMMGSAIAYFVSSLFSRQSLYQRLLEVSGIQLTEETTTNDLLSGLTADDVMQKRVETLPVNFSLDQTIQVFSDAHHEGFPVVDRGELVGLITTSQANQAKRRGQPGDTPIESIMSELPATVRPESPLSDVLYVMELYHLSHLPVTEGRKLLGIITRNDIIRAEANQLSASMPHNRDRTVPMYRVYQTRAPNTGQGRVLLPLSNPDTAQSLIRLGIAIARQYNYELECVHIHVIPKHRLPDQIAVDLSQGQALFQTALQLAQQWNVSVHTQILVSQNCARALLETIAERHIDILLLGWKGSTNTHGRIFGNAVDTLIQKAPCDVVLVKLGDRPFSYPNNLNAVTNWIVPIAGGPNSERAIGLLGAFQQLTRSSRIWLCKVYPPKSSPPDITELDNIAIRLKNDFNIKAMPLPIRAQAVAPAIVHLARAEECDAIVLGASREGMLQQAIHGNIPEEIATGVDCTVILVRSAID